MADYNQTEGNEHTKLRYIRPLIVLVPAFIVCLINIKTHIGLWDALWRLLIVILVFCVIGTFVQYKIRDMVIAADVAALERQEQMRKEARQKSLEEEEEDEDEESSDNSETGALESEE